ncbi:MAG: NrdH-redoxin [Actinomycetia bacterium]|nr:NrdH-redoxin [Actinomycetes bacterium]
MGETPTIYGTDWCGDCRSAKQYFADNSVEYTWVDVEANPDEIETVMRYNSGRRTIPVVVFDDGSHLTEPSNAELAAKLSS